MTKAEKRCEWLTDKYILCLLGDLSTVHGLSRLREPHGGKILALHRRDGALGARHRGVPLHRRTPFCKKAGRVFLSNVRVPRLESRFRGAQPVAGENVPRRGAVRRLFTQFLYALTALGIARWGRKKIIYVRVFGASVFLCCAVALWQIAGGNPLGLYPNGWRFADAGTLYSGMYLGTVGNTLILGSVLSLAVPVLVYTAVKKRGYDLLLLLPAAMALYILYRSECSSAWVALPGSCALMLPKLTRGRRRRYILGGGGRFGADRAARGVFLSGAERDAV